MPTKTIVRYWAEYFALLTPAEKVGEDAVKLAADNLTQLEGPAYELLAGIMQEAAKHPRGVLQSAYSGLMQVKSSTFQKAVLTKDRKLLDKLIQVSKETDGPGAAAQIEQYEMEFAKANGDMSLVRKTTEQKAETFMKFTKEELAKMDSEQYALFKKQAQLEGVDSTDSQYKMMQDMMQSAATKGTAMELNNLAWSYVESMTDKADWTKALAWSARSLELDRDANYLDTYANLLYKVGQKTGSHQNCCRGPGKSQSRTEGRLYGESGQDEERNVLDLNWDFGFRHSKPGSLPKSEIPISEISFF